MDVEGSIKFPLVPGVIRFDADQMGLPRWAGTPRQASSFIALSDVPSFFLSPSSFIYTFFLPSDLTVVLHSSVCSTHCILSSFSFRGDKIPFPGIFGLSLKLYCELFIYLQEYVV